MPCSLSVLEPPPIVEPLARQLDGANSAPWDTREHLMALDVVPITEIVELFRVGNFLMRLVELLVADEARVVGVN
jgi:hypothetical protein